MIIAHTQSKVTLARKSVGDTVNIEVDMLGKYVEKAVIARLGGDSEVPGTTGESLRLIIENVVERVLKQKKDV
jgi:riboflavin synthase